jgi:hypothetical protein
MRNNGRQFGAGAALFGSVEHAGHARRWRYARQAYSMRMLLSRMIGSHFVRSAIIASVN